MSYQDPAGQQPHAPGTPPDWYPDPHTPNQLRYWDGQAWTTNVTPAYTTPIAPLLADPLDLPNGQAYVGFGRAVTLGFKQYVKFSGRSSRSEYWWWYLFQVVLVAIVSLPGYIQLFNDWLPKYVDFLQCLSDNSNSGDVSACHLAQLPPLIFVGSLVGLALLLPGLGVLVRRLHDTGKSGWWYWIVLVPLVGGILLIVYLASKPTEGANQYGPPPRKGKANAGTLA